MRILFAMETFKSPHTQDKGPAARTDFSLSVVLVSTKMCFMSFNSIPIASVARKYSTWYRCSGSHDTRLLGNMKCGFYIRKELYDISRCQSNSLFLQGVIFNISISDHMKKLKNVSLVGNTGYFDNKVDYAGSEDLDGVIVVNIKPHVDPFVFPVVLSLSLSFRNSSIRKWQRCNFLHSVRPSPSVPTNTEITSESSLKALLLSAIRVPICSSRLYKSLERPRVDADVLLRNERVCHCGASGSE